MRLTILGGGGFRVPLVYQALLDGGDVGWVDEVVLHDVDADRLSAIVAVLERQAAGSRRPVPVRIEADLDDALRGTDVVFSAIRVGGLAGRAADETVALAAGVLGQETVGAGGISYGLRTVPVVDEVARRIAVLAPDAWVVNFTNPAGLVTEAMSQVLGDRVIGICDSPIGMGRRVVRALGLDPGRAWLDYVGLNHLGWLRRVLVDGYDRLPELLVDDAALTSFEEGELFGGEWLRALGAVPNEYLHYYYRGREALAAIQAAGHSRGQALQDQQQQFYAAVAENPPAALDLWQRARAERELTYMAENRTASGAAARASSDLDDGGYEGVALAVLRAITLDERTSLILDVRNRGAVPGFDADAVVEVPCLVDSNGARPLAVGALTDHQAALLHAVKGVERQTLAAARTGSRRAALRAFATHPLVDSVAVAQRLLDGYLDALPALRDVLHRD